MGKKKKIKHQPTASAEPTQSVGQEVNTPSKDGNPLFKKIFLGSVIIQFLLMSVLSFDFGITGDELDMNAYGEAVFDYYTSFGEDETVFNMPKEFNRDGVAQYYGGFFDLVAATVKPISPFNEFQTRHLLNAWTGWVAMLFAGLIAAYLAGYRAGLLALWIIFLSPVFFGHSMNNPKDIPFAAAYVFSVYWMLRFMDGLPKPGWKLVVPLIIGIAVSINVRIGGLLSIAYLGLFVGLEYLQANGWMRAFSGNFISKVKGYALPTLLVGVLGYFGGTLLWPYALQNPISNPLKTLEVMGDFVMNIPVLFEGVQMSSGDLPGYYLPKLLYITNPIVFILGFILFAGLFYFSYKQFKFWRIALVAFTGIFPIAYIIYTDANVYGNWRHILFTYPSLVVLAALGWEFAIRKASKPALKMAVGGLVVALCLLPVRWYFVSHPYQYVYFNELTGGVEANFSSYTTDFWMQGANGSTNWLIEEKDLTGEENIIIGTNAFFPVREYLRLAGIDNKTQPITLKYYPYSSRHQTDWDYGIFYADFIPAYQLENGLYPPDATIYHEQVVEGVPICAVLERTTKADMEGFAALNNGDVATAVTKFEEAVKAYPNSDMVQFGMGIAYANTGKLDQALTHLLQCIQLNPSSRQAYEAVAGIYQQQGKNQEAQQYINRARQIR